MITIGQTREKTATAFEGPQYQGWWQREVFSTGKSLWAPEMNVNESLGTLETPAQGASLPKTYCQVESCQLHFGVFTVGPTSPTHDALMPFNQGQ